MLSEHIDLIESLGLKLFFVAIFVLIGLAIQDVLKRGNVPRLPTHRLVGTLPGLCRFCRQGADRTGLGRLRHRLTYFHL